MYLEFEPASCRKCFGRLNSLFPKASTSSYVLVVHMYYHTVVPNVENPPKNKFTQGDFTRFSQASFHNFRFRLPASHSKFVKSLQAQFKYELVFPRDGTSRDKLERDALLSRAGANVPGQTPLSRPVPGQNDLKNFKKKRPDFPF